MEFKTIELKESIFANNDREADRLRAELKGDKTFLLNLMSSPGSGKTTTLLRTVERLRDGGTPAVVFYEGGGRPLAELVGRQTRRLAIVVGPEGGFEPAEIEELRALGAETATLGPRILRCESAPLAVLSAVMTLTDNLE